MFMISLRCCPISNLLASVFAGLCLLFGTAGAKAQAPPEIPIHLETRGGKPEFLSPDGKILVGSGYDAAKDEQQVQFWDSSTGKLLHSWADKADSIMSPDGTVMARLAGADLEMREVSSGKDLSWKNVQGARLRGLAFSPDGKMLATACAECRVILWDRKTEIPIAKFQVSIGRLLCFSPDSKLLIAVRWDGPIWLYEISTQKVLDQLDSHQGQIGCLAFSRDSKLLATGESNAVHLWEVATGKLRTTLKHDHEVSCLAFSPDGRMLATSTWQNADPEGPMELKIWDIVASKQLQSFKPDAHRINSLTFSPDGRRLFVFSFASQFHTYDVAALLVWKPPAPRLALAGSGLPVRSLDYSGDGSRLAVAQADDTVKLWDAHTGKPLFVTPKHAGQVEHLLFSPDDKTMVTISKLEAASSNEVNLWNIDTGAEQWTKQVHLWGLPPVFTSDSRLLAVNTRQEVILLDARTGAERKRIGVSGDRIIHLALSKDGQSLFTVSEIDAGFAQGIGHQFGAEIRRWELPSGREISMWKATPSPGVPVYHLYPDNNAFAYAKLVPPVGFFQWKTEGVTLCDLDSGKERFRLKSLEPWTGSLQFAPAVGAAIAMTDKDSIWLWDMATGAERVLLRGVDIAGNLLLSPDGKYLATGYSTEKGNGFTQLWEIATGRKLSMLQDTTLQRFSP
ncbi:MAG TPA: WD40 repeat domain-containing protein, partial [Gemmataceae bacterium]|nr:WD40 repeat domain-containing protein [Gemmataceae bacterium]